MFKIFVAVYLLTGGPPQNILSSSHVYDTVEACEAMAKAGPDEDGSPQTLVKAYKDQLDLDVKVVAVCAPADGGPPDFPAE